MSKTLIVTHTDLDGVMSGLVAKYATSNESDIRYADAGAAGIDAVLEDVLAGDDQYTQAIFLDNTPSAEMLAKFHNQTNLTPTVYDHHVSNQDVWESATVDATFVTDQTGTSSATELAFNDNQTALAKLPFLPVLVKLTNLYDTWTWQDERYADEQQTGQHAQVFNEVFNFIGRDRFSAFMDEATNKTFAEVDVPSAVLATIFSDLIMALVYERIKSNQDYVAKKAEKAEFADLVLPDKTYHYAYATASSQMSEIGNALTNLPDVDFGLVINNGKLSFRVAKDKDVDVSVIAGYFNGGGHAKASGAKLVMDWPTIIQNARNK